MRTSLRALITLAWLIPAATAAADPQFSPNTDRPGWDYWNGTLPSASACQSSCVSDSRCAAWSFQEGPHICWHKYAYVPAVPANGITAGVVPGRLEDGVDHTGTLINSFSAGAGPGASVDACRAACQADPTCDTFTFDTLAAGRKSQRQTACWLRHKSSGPVAGATSFDESSQDCNVCCDPQIGCHSCCQNYSATYSEHLVSGVDGFGMTFCNPRCYPHAGACGDDFCGGSCGGCSGQDQCEQVGQINDYPVSVCECVPTDCDGACHVNNCGEACGTCGLKLSCEMKGNRAACVRDAP